MENASGKSEAVAADLPPGPELDAAVAEKVMGWAVGSLKNYLLEPGQFIRRPLDGEVEIIDIERGPNRIKSWAPSTSIADAWEVVDKLVAEGFEFNCSRETTSFSWAQFFKRKPCGECTEKHGDATAATAPHAICLAALKAVAE